MTTPLEDLVRLSEPEFFMAYPYDVFARLRAEAPVYRSERDRMWAVTRYEDVRFVSKSPQLFANRFGLAAGQTRTEDDGIAAAPDPSHLAFGFAEHFCLGAALARREARLVLGELLRRYPRYEILDEDPTRVRAHMTPGIKRMRAVFAP
jgi:cytochrome P450